MYIMEAFHLALNEILTWKSGNPNYSKYGECNTYLLTFSMPNLKISSMVVFNEGFYLLCISSLRDQSKEHVVQARWLQSYIDIP